MDASSVGDNFGGIERAESGEWKGQGSNPLKKEYSPPMFRCWLDFEWIVLVVVSTRRVLIVDRWKRM